MTFQITGLSPAPFEHLFGLSDEALARHGAIRVIADANTGFPDRVGLKDAEVGESLLLVNYTHQPADTPFRASHAIFVREAAAVAHRAVNEAPQALRDRLLSLRAFDAAGMMLDADVVEGAALKPVIERLFGDPKVAYLHAHYARRGCYAARIDRA